MDAYHFVYHPQNMDIYMFSTLLSCNIGIQHLWLGVNRWPLKTVLYKSFVIYGHWWRAQLILVLFKIAFYKGIEAREDIILWVKIH